MKTKYFILAASALVALASCSNDEYIGDNNGLTAGQGDGSIQFVYTMPNATRADIVGPAAAEKLGNNFYVTGTKGEEQTNSPSTTVVFDNYLVHYGANTAGTTESNTANWEYVGIDQEATPSPLPADYHRVKISGISGAQTIKYWDYSQKQYDFLAFSTGTFYAVKDKAIGALAANEINVTPMATGDDLKTGAYTFKLNSTDALANTFITDIKTVTKESGAYGKDVVLQFKNLGSKIRVALYETVPGYSVRDVKFYTADGTPIDPADTDDPEDPADPYYIAPVDDATLISADANGIPNKGEILVYFPVIGKTNRDASPKSASYNKASATVTPVADAYDKNIDFDALTNQLVAKERAEKNSAGTATESGNVFLGRTLPTATFAGNVNDQYYKEVFPVSTSAPLTLRVNYTLVPIDGAKETITVYGAKAVVPSTYTKWLPNYAYTYIFKISDNTNGYTDVAATAEGLFPITFDAVVTEATDATAEQKTITTVATPSITTYQQKHEPFNEDEEKQKNEYSKATGKNIYVQIMKDGVLVSNLNTNTSDDTPTPRSILFGVSDANATEALVMDALEKRTTAITTVATVKGRNGLTLTQSDKISNTAVEIKNGVDDTPVKKINGVDIAQGQLAEINISLAAGTYAYVYDYSTTAKAVVDEYQPIVVTTGSDIGVTDQDHYASITTTVLDGLTAASNFTVDEGDVEGKGEAVASTHIYFSKTTTDGGTTYTYSYYSVAGKDRVPAGLLKVAKTSLTKNVDGSTDAVDGTIYFDVYQSNDGKYGVKIIKVVA